MAANCDPRIQTLQVKARPSPLRLSRNSLPPQPMELPETNHHKRILHSKRSFGKPSGHKVDSPAYDASVFRRRFPSFFTDYFPAQRRIMTRSPMTVPPLSLLQHRRARMLPLSIAFKER